VGKTGIIKCNSKTRNGALTQRRGRRTGIKDEAKTEAETEAGIEGGQRQNDDDYYYVRTVRVRLADIEKKVKRHAVVGPMNQWDQTFID
jgi:hypothetical protein